MNPRRADTVRKGNQWLRAPHVVHRCAECPYVTDRTMSGLVHAALHGWHRGIGGRLRQP